MAELDRSIYGKAADVIRERGYKSPGFGWVGPVCLEGGINVACHGTPDYSFMRGACCLEGTCSRAFWELEDALGQNPYDWNDFGQSSEDCLLLLKYAEADELQTWAALYGPEASE